MNKEFKRLTKWIPQQVRDDKLGVRDDKGVHKKTAFTLVELSIVLTVILIIITGVLKGGALTQTSRILGARSITAKSVVPQINGLFAWYEASTKNSFLESQASNGAQITTWYDIGSSPTVPAPNTLTKTPAAANVTYVDEGINKVPSILFDGSSSSSKITLLSFYQGSSAQNTIFLVFNPNSLTSRATLFDSISTGNTASIGIQSNALTINAGNLLSGSAKIETNNSYIVAAYFNGTISKIYMNDSETAIASGNSGSNALTGLTIGATKSGTEMFTGMISEVIIYDRILAIQERRDVFRYLADKYKITVTGI
jgi:hypothetical protein